MKEIFGTPHVTPNYTNHEIKSPYASPKQRLITSDLHSLERKNLLKKNISRQLHFQTHHR